MRGRGRRQLVMGEEGSERGLKQDTNTVNAGGLVLKRLTQKMKQRKALVEHLMRVTRLSTF